MQRKSVISIRLSPGRSLPGTARMDGPFFHRLAISALGALCALGCSGGPQPTNDEQPAKPYANHVVRIACPTGPRGDLLVRMIRRYAAGWAARTGGQFQIVRYAPISGPRAGPPADVWALPPAEMPHWAAAGELEAVPDAIRLGAAYDWDKLLPLYKSILLVWGEKAYALPLLGETWLCFYRLDLFGDAREQAGFRRFLKSRNRPIRDLSAPRTWSEFAEVAEYFNNRPRPGIDHPCASLPPLPDDEEEIDRTFYSVAAPLARRAVPEDERPQPPESDLYPFHYDLNAEHPRINGPGFVQALELLRRLQAYRPAATVREPEEAFHDGEAVLCLASPAWVSRFQDSTSRVRGKFGFCRVPGSEQFFPYPGQAPQPARHGANQVPYLGAGGWLAVVPLTAAEPQAAFDLLADLSGPQTSLQAVLEPAWGGSGFRREHFEERSGWSAFGLGQDETVMLRQTVGQTMSPALLNPVVRLRTPDQQAHFQALVKAVRSSLREKVDARQALDHAARAWEEIDRGKPAEHRRRDYRLSLGLAP